MKTDSEHSWLRMLGAAVLTLFLCGAGIHSLWAEEVEEDAATVAEELSEPAEVILERLRGREQQVRETVIKVLPSVVALTPLNGSGGGSGVVVSEDGIILTAGHVTQATGKEFFAVFSDGRRVKAAALGSNLDRDAGMARIVDGGPFPFLDLGDAAEVRLGDWCVAMGHPGGFETGRTPPVRLGRILRQNDKGFFVTDCTLAAGDSGGPLFNLEGEVIGINSSISGSVAQNLHVAADAFRESWDRLLSGENWGDLSKAMDFGPSDLGDYFGPPKSKATLDAWLDRRSQEGVVVKQVWPDSAAGAAGMQAGDVILRFGDESIDDYEGLRRLLALRNPGDRIIVEVRRGAAQIELEIELGEREESGQEEDSGEN
ncbi:MAG TPA: trypsin-like peptidase domain-containing protein [Verrucomicrobiales bacterium]|nr:trypsin-like peptidase domain-containing protein [Verrucomicrobiales bacterium]